MTLTKKILPLAADLPVAVPSGSAMAAPKPKVQFSAPAFAAAENSGSATISVVRPRNGHSSVRLNQPVTVDFTTIDGTAKAGSDYGASAGTLSFPACSGPFDANNPCVKQTVSVPVYDDFVADGPRTLSLKLSNARSGTRTAILGFPSTAALVIADNDNSGVGSGSTFQVASASDYVSEAAGSASVFVIRSGDLSAGAAVHYATSDGAALAGTDYAAKSGTLNFPTQSTDPVTSIIQVVQVALLHNAATAPQLRDFNLGLDIPAGTGGTLGSPSSENVSIVNSDGTPTLLWTAPSYSVSEKAGSAQLTALAAGSITGNDEVDVDYQTADGTAVAGINYTASTDTLQFFADDFAETVEIPVLDDGRAGDKAFTAQLLNPSAGAAIGAPGTATVNIVDSGVRSKETSTSPGAGGDAGAGAETGGTGASQVVLGVRQAACGLTIKAAKKQKLVKQKVLKLTLKAAQTCKVTLATTIKQLRSKKKSVRSAKALAFKGTKASLTLQPGKAKTVKVKFTKKTLKAMKKALRARKSFVANVLVTTKDSASKVQRKTLKITIRGYPPPPPATNATGRLPGSPLPGPALVVS